jgi:hypothetical protein
LSTERHKRPDYTTLDKELAWIERGNRSEATQAAIEQTLEDAPPRTNRLVPVYERPVDQNRALLAQVFGEGPIVDLDYYYRFGPAWQRPPGRPDTSDEPREKLAPTRRPKPGPYSWQWLRDEEALEAALRRAAKACACVPKRSVSETLRFELGLLNWRVDRWFRRGRYEQDEAAELIADYHDLSDRFFVHELFETIRNLPAPKPLGPRAEKRDAIFCALLLDRAKGRKRSDYEIAHEVAREFGKCSRTTVGDVRREVEASFNVDVEQGDSTMSTTAEPETLATWRADAEERLQEVERWVGLPPGGRKRAEEAVDQFIDSAQAPRRVVSTAPLPGGEMRGFAKPGRDPMGE